jgi:hypothetical protein
LEVLGFEPAAAGVVHEVRIVPEQPRIGGNVRVTAVVGNAGSRRAAFNVDLRVHFVKASGATSPKVFKLREIELEAGERVTLSKVISLRQQTTRTHHPGDHLVEVVVNGSAHRAGSFPLA